MSLLASRSAGKLSVPTKASLPKYWSDKSFPSRSLSFLDMGSHFANESPQDFLSSPKSCNTLRNLSMCCEHADSAYLRLCGTQTHCFYPEAAID